MALMLILQLLTLWPLCHTDITPSVPPASYYPKPWLGAQPATVVTPGVNVTLRCRAPQPAWRFGLFKPGEIAPLLFRDVSSELAEFFLEEVTPAQGGSYRCCYRRPDWGPGVWSQPSDALELLVTEKLPRPSLVALPGPVVAPGANLSLRCAGRLRNMSFVLYREGVAAPLQYRDSAQPWADFPLLGARAPGTYSCYYHTPSAPYVLSQRSEVLVISWEGEGPKARPASSAPGMQAPGPPPSDPGAQAPSPSSFRPRDLVLQAFLPQTQDSWAPAPPPSDPGFPGPSTSSLRPRTLGPQPLLPGPRSPGPQPLLPDPGVQAPAPSS
ncbi:osteoclast-associated immunoglobulin-like receptor isoform X2 [Nomascus leucogenys]|uniref:osteoclast-associated immunoglobulin-like receptor isoform X2 n=1 Tax=Nomascus leucogenys TaxID=61853 RepID=UPI00122D9E71|nr:osteoclast-associated immunoglobulin-like receptor isoform X2 [Nomascus leucogenys]